MLPTSPFGYVPFRLGRVGATVTRVDLKRLDWLDRASAAESEDRIRAREDLACYFGNVSGVPRHSGSRFSSFRCNAWDRIDVDDLIAVSMLSVHVPGRAALRYLERDAAQITALLRDIPTDCDLHAASAGHIDSTSPAWQLRELLRARPTRGREDSDGAGPVATSKLLARKRPRLLPMYDSVVARELGLRSADDHWAAVRALLRENPARIETLRELHREADIPASVSLLRVLDVLLRMRGRRKAAATARETELQRTTPGFALTA